MTGSSELLTPHEHLFTETLCPRRGRLRASLVNLLLRIVVKWRQPKLINIASQRRLLGRLNEQMRGHASQLLRERVSCDNVNAEWIISAEHHAERVILYLHGGAFIAHSPDLYAAMLDHWCRSLQARALMVDYRLAPEAPYPAGVDDCVSAYRWLLRQGFDHRQIVIAGDSAGGNLALSTLLRARGEGIPLPACAVLLSPFLDLTLSGRSALANAGRDPLFGLGFGVGIRGFYARPEQLLNHDVSPLYADLGGLPPLLVQVGSTEMLLDDARQLAVKANQAGTAAKLEIWQSMPHIFQTLKFLPQAVEAHRRVVEHIRSCTTW